MLTFKHELLLSISNNMMNSFEQKKEKLYLFNIQNSSFLNAIGIYSYDVLLGGLF